MTGRNLEYGSALYYEGLATLAWKIRRCSMIQVQVLPPFLIRVIRGNIDEGGYQLCI